MARTVIPIKTSNRNIAQAAISWTAADTTNEMSFDNSSGKVLLLVKNAHSSPHTVTIKRPASVDGTALGDVSLAVANGTEAVFGPFPESIYNQADAGNSLADAVLIDIGPTPTNLFLAVVKVGSLS